MSILFLQKNGFLSFFLCFPEIRRPLDFLPPLAYNKRKEKQPPLRAADTGRLKRLQKGDVQIMETEFQHVTGKSVGEVVRDVTEFLSCSCTVHAQRRIDLATLLPDLHMHGQFSFALLSEALTQGMTEEEAERFYRHACSGVISPATLSAMLAAFRDRSGEAWKTYEKKYGNRFSLSDGSYWSSCLAVGIDAQQMSDVLHYLRLFTVVLMEFAYMGGRNPEKTYTWTYYESFRAMLDTLMAEPEPDPLPLKVLAVGGTAGKREGDAYLLSLGLDLENPNPDRMARDVHLDILLKDREGNVIATVKDRLASIDPGAIYHYGITRKLRGAAVASISATAKAGSHLKLSTPIMTHASLDAPRIEESEDGAHLAATLRGGYDRPLRSLTLHYQFRSQEDRLLGGGGEWIADGLAEAGERELRLRLPLAPKDTARLVYSVDFDALELID